jgi:FkbM family methyltransferase
MLRNLTRLLSFIWSHPLNKHGRFAAFGRLLRWQIASRLLAGPIALPFVNGTYLFASRGMTGATGNYYCGLHEYEDMSFALHFLQRNDLFVDVGANIGSYAILAAGGGGAQVIALEPIPETFESLARNVMLNGLEKKIRILNIGAGSRSDELLFSASQDTVNHVLAKGEAAIDIVTVPVRSLDEVLLGCIPNLIKIDVEGFETEVISGATKTLSDPRVLAVIMELNGSGNRYGLNEDELHLRMLAFGFETYSYSPEERKLKSMKNKRNYFGNTLYLRSIDEIRSRISESSTESN